jgi:hypothetical protein
VAGFFLRDPDRPLGEVVSHGRRLAHEPVAEPWGPARACVHVDGTVRLARRSELPPVPAGDLVQAGPLLVSDGRSLVDGDDVEGFSARAGPPGSSWASSRGCSSASARATPSTSTGAGRRR